jgi:hypothetical protein
VFIGVRWYKIFSCNSCQYTTILMLKSRDGDGDGAGLLSLPPP